MSSDNRRTIELKGIYAFCKIMMEISLALVQEANEFDGEGSAQIDAGKFYVKIETIKKKDQNAPV